MLIKPVLSEYHIIGATYGSARRKALNKRNEADRRRRDKLKALEQNVKFFDILKSAGAPPNFGSVSGRGFTPRGGYTGWGYTTKVVSRSRSGERWGIDKIFYQYQEGFQHGGGKYMGQWGIRDAQITYSSADDWKRKINAAYWARKSKEAEVQKVKDIQASVIPWDVYEKQQQKRWSGRKYGLSAKTQATMASEASDAGGVAEGSGVKSSFLLSGGLTVAPDKPEDPTQVWLDNYNKEMGTSTTKADLERMNFGGDRATQVTRLLEGDEITDGERDYLEKKIREGLKTGDESTYSRELNRLMSKYSDSLSGVPGAPAPSRTTYLGVSSMGEKNAKNDTKMNFLYDEIISKIPNISVDVSNQDRDVVLASFIDKEKELTDREYEIKKQLTTGQMEDYSGKYEIGAFEKGILQTQLETISDKRAALASQKSAFMTNEEALLEAERINTEATERKKAMKALKDYKPFKDLYGAEYLNYLNPEDVSGFYERSQELPRLTATSVASTYYNILGGSDYDPRAFETYSTSFDPETDIYIKIPTGKLDAYGRRTYDYSRIPEYAKDEYGAISMSGFDSKIKKLNDQLKTTKNVKTRNELKEKINTIRATKQAIESGNTGFLGYSRTQQRAYEIWLGDEDNLSDAPVKDKIIDTRTPEQKRITDEADLAFLTKTYQVGQSEADYTQINQLSERDNFLDSQGRLRDGERYGQAMGRLYHRTKDEIPTIKIGIEALQTEVDALRVEKKALDKTYSDYRSQIRDKQEQVRETYRKEGRVDFDQGFADEIGDFAKKRQAAKLALNVKEQKLDKLKKNLAATEEELELLRKQKQDWQPTTEGGGGKIVNPARLAKYQMLAGYSTTSAMSPGERSARAQVRQRQVRSGRVGKGKGSKLMRLYRRSDKESWDATFSSFSKLSGLKKERQQIFRVSGL